MPKVHIYDYSDYSATYIDGNLAEWYHEPGVGKMLHWLGIEYVREDLPSAFQAEVKEAIKGRGDWCVPATLQEFQERLAQHDAKSLKKEIRQTKAKLRDLLARQKAEPQD